MDVYDIILRMKKQPQTYKTIFGDSWKNCTQQTVLRRKLNKFYKDGYVCKTLISFTEILFYHPYKEYTLFFESKGLHLDVYYTKEFTEDPLFVYLTRPKLLSNMHWIDTEYKKIDKEKLLKVI